MQVREGARAQVEGTCGKGSRAARTRERTPRAAATPADANARKELWRRIHPSMACGVCAILTPQGEEDQSGRYLLLTSGFK